MQLNISPRDHRKRPSSTEGRKILMAAMAAAAAPVATAVSCDLHAITLGLGNQNEGRWWAWLIKVGVVA